MKEERKKVNVLKVKQVTLLVILLLYISISPLLIATLYDLFGNIFNFLILKDISVITFVLVVFFLYFHNFRYKIILYVSPLILVLLYSFLSSHAPLFAKIASVRQIIIPYIFIFIGYSFIRNFNQYFLFLKRVLILMFFIVIFGFFERFTYLWQYFSVKEFFLAKNITVFPVGYPFIFVEPVKIVDECIDLPGTVRMVSTFLDPINLGHTLAFFLVVLIYERNLFTKSIRYVSIVIFGSALILTFSKGAILQLILVILILNRRVNNLLRIVIIVMIIGTLPFVSKYHHGILVHIMGFINTLNNITFLGHGLATVGNYAQMFAKDVKLELGIGDSFWGSIIGQIGIVGFILWLFPFIKVIKDLPEDHYLRRLLLAQLIVSSVSENSFNFLSVAFLLTTIGGYYSALKVSRSEVRNDERR